MRWLDSIINSTDMSLSKLEEIVKDRAAWRVVHGAAKSRTEQSNRTTTYKLAGLPSVLWIKRLEDVRRDYRGVAENITSLHSYYTTDNNNSKIKANSPIRVCISRLQPLTLMAPTTAVVRAEL